MRKAKPNQDNIEDNDEDDDTISLFPIENAEQINHFEEKLKNKDF